VLDEPTIGLHPADTGRLLGLLRRLADGGNTVVVSSTTQRRCGPPTGWWSWARTSGEAGGALVYQGPAAGVARGGDPHGTVSLGREADRCAVGAPDGAALARGEGRAPAQSPGVDTRIPLERFTAVTGVSDPGSRLWCTTLLFRQLESRLTGTHGAKQHLGEPVGEVRALDGWEAISDVVLVNQAPIGRTPRSNPITYIKAFDELRALFAAEPLARVRKLLAQYVLVQRGRGRCDGCDGAGHVLVEMVFLANVFVPCDVCGGKRFKKDVLDVKLAAARSTTCSSGP